MSASRNRTRNSDATGFWASKEARVALIGGSFALVCAIVAALVALKKNEDSTTAKLPSIVVQNQIPAVNVNPASQPSKSVDITRLEIEQFAINPSDSLFERCPANQCLDKVPEWQPNNDYYFLLNRGENRPTVKKIREHPSDNAWDRKEETRFLSDPSHFDSSHLNPVFDVVINNQGSQIAVLTDIEASVLAGYEESGDGGDSAGGQVVPILHRYAIELKPTKQDANGNARPYVVRVPAIPPLSIPANQVARFQVAMDCSYEDAITHYNLRLRFRFGPHAMVKTEQFRLVC